jgi:hypothetical protein
MEMVVVRLQILVLRRPTAKTPMSSHNVVFPIFHLPIGFIGLWGESGYVDPGLT